MSKTFKMQMSDVRLFGQYTGANGLYAGVDVDPNTLGNLQAFFMTLFSKGVAMPLNPKHGLHCTICYSRERSPLNPEDVRATAVDLANPYPAAKVTGVDLWENGDDPSDTVFVLLLDWPTGAQLCKDVQKLCKVEHSYKDDYKAHVTLCSGRDALRFKDQVTYINSRLTTYPAIELGLVNFGIHNLE